MIREATLDDLPILVDMALESALDSHFDIDPDIDDTAETIAQIISELGFVLFTPEAFIWVVMDRLYFRRDLVRAVETNWYSRNGRDGLSLLKEAMKLAKERGACMFWVGSQAGTRDEKIARAYSRYGFEPFSFSYMKRL